MLSYQLTQSLARGLDILQLATAVYRSGGGFLGVIGATLSEKKNAGRETTQYLREAAVAAAETLSAKARVNN